jgi:hypothetical protein
MNIEASFREKHPFFRIFVTNVSCTEVPDNVFPGNAEYSASFKEHYFRISLNDGAFKGYINKDLAGTIIPSHLQDIWYDIESGFYVKILMALRLDIPGH